LDVERTGLLAGRPLKNLQKTKKGVKWQISTWQREDWGEKKKKQGEQLRRVKNGRGHKRDCWWYGDAPGIEIWNEVKSTGAHRLRDSLGEVGPAPN